MSSTFDLTQNCCIARAKAQIRKLSSSAQLIDQHVELFPRSRFALPNHPNVPTKRVELLRNAPVSPYIRSELRQPEVAVRLWLSPTVGALMPVPEATVHEYAGPPTWHHDIWLARQPRRM